MKVNCLGCGHKVDLSEAYDDYEGEVKCFACGALLALKVLDGRVKSVRLAKLACLEKQGGRS